MSARRAAVTLVVLCLAARAGAQSIFTIAGGGTDDGQLATNVGIYGVRGLALDAAGNLYFAERFGSLVRRVDATTGTIRTVAGNGGNGFSGDGGPASVATLQEPRSVAFDPAGNLYIADSGNGRVRKVDAVTGIITTVAGRGKERDDFTIGDNGPALDAVLRGPWGVWIDRGNLYITEAGFQGERLRKVVLSTGVITTIAGPVDGSDGFQGDGGSPLNAKFSSLQHIIIDAAGNIYLSDSANNRVRRIDAATNIIDSYATVEFPTGLAFDPNGNLVVQTLNGIVRVDKTTRALTTLPPANTGLGYGMVIDHSGNILVDIYDDTVRKFAPGESDGTTVAGGGSFVGDGRVATSAILRSPEGVAVDAAGNLYIADVRDSRIRRVDAVSGVITTIAGNGGYYDNDGVDGKPATQMPIGEPFAVAMGRDGALYLADAGNGRIDRVDLSTGTLTYYAGGGNPPGGNNEGLDAKAAILHTPAGITFDAAGNLYIADQPAQRIYRVDGQTKKIATFAGTGEAGFSGDSGPAKAAKLSGPVDVAADKNGNVFISDAANNRIRRVTPDGNIATFYGDGDEGTLSPAHMLAHPVTGDLYVADVYHSRVQKIDASTRTLTTFAGSGTAYYIDPDFSGDNGPATAAKLNMTFEISGVAVNSKGDLFVSDTRNNRVRVVYACTSVAVPQLSAPADNAASVSTAPTLAWADAAGAFRYDVKLDTVTPPQRVVASDVSETTFTPSNLQPATKYYWSVTAKGDPYCTPASTATSAIRSFTTSGSCTAGAFDAISPAEGEHPPAQNVTLAWGTSAGAASYDVYFGAVNPPPLVQTGITQTSFSVRTTTGTYYWFVVAHASCDRTHTASTSVRSFVSANFLGCSQAFSITPAQPANGATSVSTSVDLTWSASDFVTSYDLYFGTSSPPPLFASNLSEAKQSVTGLAPGTTYFWRVEAHSPCVNGVASSATFTFATRTCAAPGATSILFAPDTVSAGSTYTVVWSVAPALDGDGGYLIERSASPSFATILDAQVTSSTAASFVADSTGTFYHRVRAVPGCDPTKGAPPSDGKGVAVTSARPNVVFTVQPAAAITAIGDRLEDKRGSFAIENLGDSTLQVIVGRQELGGSPPFFSIVDPQGADVAFVTLEPRKPHTFEIRYAGPRNDTAAAYQGVIFVASTGQGLSVTPYAFVNLKVGGGTSAAPQIFGASGPTEYAAFPGFSGDDTNRPALQVSVKNPGSTPLELAAEIGPEVWLVPETNWNATPIAAGASRTLNLFTRRSRAPNGSALPRYTYLTLRTKDGSSARLLVQDNDQVAQLTGRPQRLDVGARSFIVPHVASVVVDSKRIATRLRLSNVGNDAVQVELIYTPTTVDGFDPSAVKRVVVVAPPNDVVTLTDPIATFFSNASASEGSIEVRVPRERLGLIGVTSSTAIISGGSGGGFAIPTVNRGDGARAGAPHVIYGVTGNPTVTTGLVLSETSGVDGATVQTALFDSSGNHIGDATTNVPRYGHVRIANIVTAAGGTTVSNGRLEVRVTSGGGSVVGLALVGAANGTGGASILSRAIDEQTAAASVLRAFAAKPSDTTLGVTLVVPVLVSTTPQNTSLKTTVVFAAPPDAAATFTAIFHTPAGAVLGATKSVTLGAGKTQVYIDAPSELFGLPSNTAGSVAVASSNGRVTATLLQSTTSPGAVATPVASLPVPTNVFEALTSAGSSAQRPLFFDGMEQSLDPTRGSRWMLVLNEVGGGAGLVNVRLYEAGNRTLPIGDKNVLIAPYQQLQLDTVFSELGLDTPERRKERTNVQCVVTAVSGPARVAASAVSTDNASGDTKIYQLIPSVGSATPSVSLVTPSIVSAPSTGKHRGVRH